MKILRLILGDQLNINHSWFKETSSDVTYLMAEMRQETDYVTHHIQKIIAFFTAMRNFASTLKEKGHQVVYYTVNAPNNPQNLPDLIHQVLAETKATHFEYQLPDEFRLDTQLHDLAAALPLETRGVDTEHFYTDRNTLAQFFHGKKQFLMESFYRMMRRKHSVLMQGDQPFGGQWNYDHDNRKKWSGNPPIPPHGIPNIDVAQLVNEIKSAGIHTIGSIDTENFSWPVTRNASLQLLDHFCNFQLPFFGTYQDAMHQGEPFLFHSRLSFALNTKLLGPEEVVTRVEQEYFKRPDEIHISQAEGFIRQILGWREYMRGIYWREMPSYAQRNKLENNNPLPAFFWTGDTQMNCLKQAITQSLETAYAHHIQRLMITGNFALLMQTNPDEVDAWYLGIYIDALQWVEITNTRGMSQFADGGLLATKPYISSANYIRNMSNYCSGCAYNPKEALGETACPFNSLYWNFLAEKRQFLSKNPRMGMMYKLLDKKQPEELRALQEKAAAVIAHPERY